MVDIPGYFRMGFYEFLSWRACYNVRAVLRWLTLVQLAVPHKDSIKPSFQSDHLVINHDNLKSSNLVDEFMIYQLNIADFQLAKRGDASLCQDWQPNFCWWRISSKLRKLQGIADFENELKTYQGGLKKEAYYFYKRHLDNKNIADLFKATERPMVEPGCKFMSLLLSYHFVWCFCPTSCHAAKRS